MKHIIIEGGDRLGKSTLIEKLCSYFNYDNVTVRHFGKPPKKFPEYVTPFHFQQTCFLKEANLLNYLDDNDRDALYTYYENILIWNRAHLGEYVYGQMFRKTDPKEIKEFLKYFESDYLLKNQNTFLILLTADVEFFFKQEDGQSFSQNLQQKKKELALFDEAFENSNILNKLRIKVNEENDYKSKETIFNQVLELLAI